MLYIGVTLLFGLYFYNWARQHLDKTATPAAT